MPITGRTLAEAAETFRDHLNRVLSKTITQTRVIFFGNPEVGLVQLAFRQDGRSIRAPLGTRFGRIELYIGQVCGSFLNQDKSHQLFTYRYKYALYPDSSDEPIIRWEYIKEPKPGDQWCRHHVQGPIDIHVNDYQLSLNDMHLPTGYVAFEEVIRFCITDLGVQPISEDWHETLVESYEQFKIDFVQRQ